MILVDWMSEWWYADGKVEPREGNEYTHKVRQPGFDPSSDPQFKIGRGAFTYGRLDGQPPDVHTNTILQRSDLTDDEDDRNYYFVKDFTIADLDDVKRMRISVINDDGVSVYINGSEAISLRVEHPHYQGLNAASNGREGHPDIFEFVGDQLSDFFQTGSNRVGVTLFNQSRSSSDAGFDMKIEVNPDVEFHCSVMPCFPTQSVANLNFETFEPAEIYVEYGPSEEEIDKYSTATHASLPFYHDDFQIPGTWRQRPGVFGYGELTGLPDGLSIRTELQRQGGSSSNRSFYFRRTFEVPDASVVSKIEVNRIFDDGLAFWINGVKFNNQNVSEPLTHGKAADTAWPFEGQPIHFEDSTPTGLSFLRDGTNTISCMLFNQAATSSDAGFDLELILTESGTPRTAIEHGSDWYFDDRDADYASGQWCIFDIRIPSGEADFAPGGLVWYRLRYRRRKDDDYPFEDEFTTGIHHKFRLARPRTDEGPWSFTMGHDTRNRPQEQDAAFMEFFWPAAGKQGEDFHINAGDAYNAITSGTAATRSMRGPLFGHGRENEKCGDLPMYWCIGNHEEDQIDGNGEKREWRWPIGSLYDLGNQQNDPPTAAGFSTSWKERYYWWTCGNVLFMALDNETFQHKPSMLYFKQRAWIERTLELHKDYPFKILYHHRALDEADPHHGNTHTHEDGMGESQAFLLDLCEKYGVTVFTYGHYHGIHIREGPTHQTGVWFFCCTFGSPLGTFKGTGPTWFPIYRFLRVRVGQRWTGPEGELGEFPEGYITKNELGQVVLPDETDGEIVTDPKFMIIEIVDPQVATALGGTVRARYNVTVNVPRDTVEPSPGEVFDLSLSAKPGILAVEEKAFTMNFVVDDPAAAECQVVYDHVRHTNWWAYRWREPVKNPGTVQAGFPDQVFTFRVENEDLRPGAKVFARVVGRPVGTPRWLRTEEQAFMLARPNTDKGPWLCALKGAERTATDGAFFATGVVDHLYIEEPTESTVEFSGENPEFYLSMGDMSSAGAGVNDARVNDNDEETKARYVSYRFHVDEFMAEAPLSIPHMGSAINQYEGETRYWGQSSMDLGAKWRQRYLPGFDNGPAETEGGIDLYKQRAFHFAWGDACFLVLSGHVAQDAGGPVFTPPKLTEAKKAWIVETLQHYHDLNYTFRFIVDSSPIRRAIGTISNWTQNPTDQAWLEDVIDKYGVQAWFTTAFGTLHNRMEFYIRPLPRYRQGYFEFLGAPLGFGHFRLKVGFRGTPRFLNSERWTTVYWVRSDGFIDEATVAAWINAPEAPRTPTAALELPENSLVLNNAGTSSENPIVEGFAMRLQLNKTVSGEALRRCWVTLDGPGGGVARELTALCVEEDERIYADILTGRDLVSGKPPRLNVVHFTTTNGHTASKVWVASQPPNRIELDGYNGESADEPLIWPLYTG